MIGLDNPGTRAGPYRPDPESDLGLRWSRRPCRASCAEGAVPHRTSGPAEEPEHEDAIETLDANFR